MDDVLDSKFEEENNRFPMDRHFYLINKIESVILLIIVFFRIERIQYLINQERENDLFGLICDWDQESGWTFVIIIILLFTNLIIAKNEAMPIHWSIKITGLLAIQMTTNFTYVLANGFFFIVLIYYMSANVSKVFKIKKVSSKVFYILLGLIGVFVIGYLHSEIQLIRY